MKKAMIFAILVMSLVFLSGCYSTAPVVDPSLVSEEDSAPPEEEQVVHVLEPEQVVEEVEEETVVEDSKQIVTGGDDIGDELDIISNVDCAYGVGGPERFSFTLRNIEDKKWVFNSLSYASRDTSDNPIVVLNALQVTNGQIQEACGKKSLAIGASVVCNFNLESPTQKMVQKSIRTGVTALGGENENTLSVRTGAHAAETRFLCE